MAFFKRESLELLRQRVDLAEVVEAHVELKRAGAAYKGLCRSSKLIQT
jgi:DNA primase